MMTRLWNIPIALLVAAACAHGPPPLEAQPSDSLKSLADGLTICRDAYGVPHVQGETDAATVFGYMYAQTEDALGEVDRAAMSRLSPAILALACATPLSGQNPAGAQLKG